MEMNIHIPQSLESRAELENLSATKFKIISAQGSSNIIQIVQDSLAASYSMTMHNEPLTKSEFFNISMNGDKKGQLLWSPEREATIKQVLISKGKPDTVYNGRGLFSLILPEDFIYEKRNDCHPTEPILKIYKGVLYEGALSKVHLGNAHNSLIQVILKEYGEDTASEFIDNVHFICNHWLLVVGFSIGLEDCLINDPKCATKIQDNILKCFIEAEEISKNTYNQGIKEVRVSAALNKAKDIGMKIAKNDMASTNNFLTTVMAGSKGDFFNISQVTGLLGQQNLVGQRIKPILNKNTRTLVHYPMSGMTPEQEYESRGFIRHSFVEGLTPQEFYFHAQSGREGVSDTAMGTARSGYTQRKMIKTCEDIQVKYDGTVRDINNNIYQLVYGENGMNPCSTVKVKDKQQPCDISRVVNQLNLQYEDLQEKRLKNNIINIPVIKKIETPSSKEILVIKQEINKPRVFNRVYLLRELAVITGKKNMYTGKTDLELFEMIESFKSK
jgi:DNA-directed RNA polymerase II subunit RPB1